MHKCGANPLYLASIAIGSFLVGGAVGLWLSKDEEDIFDENCVKIEDLDGIENDYIRSYRMTDIAEAYSNMVKELYPDSYNENHNLDFAEIVEDDEEDSQDDILKDKKFYRFDKDDEEDTSYDSFYNEDGEEVAVEDEDTIVEKVEDKNFIEPYIIAIDDFQLGTEYKPETLIYYEEDDTLATDRDEVIYDIGRIIGNEALNRFGHMSGDKDTVLVRNENLGIDYEIRREDGSYKEMVLGIELDDEKALKNAQKAFNKRMANEDIER